MPLAVAVGPDPSGAEVFLGYTAWCPALVPVPRISTWRQKAVSLRRGHTKKGGVYYAPCPWRVLCKDQDQATQLLESHLSQHRGELQHMREGEW